MISVQVAPFHQPMPACLKRHYFCLLFSVVASANRFYLPPLAQIARSFFFLFFYRPLCCSRRVSRSSPCSLALLGKNTLTVTDVLLNGNRLFLTPQSSPPFFGCFFHALVPPFPLQTRPCLDSVFKSLFPSLFFINQCRQLSSFLSFYPFSLSRSSLSWPFSSSLVLFPRSLRSDFTLFHPL